MVATSQLLARATGTVVVLPAGLPGTVFKYDNNFYFVILYPHENQNSSTVIVLNTYRTSFLILKTCESIMSKI